MGSEEEKFALLVNIIKCGRLRGLYKPGIYTTDKYRCERAGELLAEIGCVCFCDIPDRSLYIHTKKYGSFGIGFSKQYLVAKGARPMMYIPLNCDIKDVSPTDTPKNPKEYFPAIIMEGLNLGALLTMINDKVFPFSNIIKGTALTKHLNILNTDVVNAVRSGRFQQLIFAQMTTLTGNMSYIKLFDATLSPEDEDNYYMEREWRILSDVEFDLDNIIKIYLPNRKYEKLFMDEFPSYGGKFVYVNGQ